ncbi:MAG: hypothetical protein LBJ63_00295 [Prevotellaceae bacterium]|nr:hypothetical protein [Prevotellaceae bacterium]
MKKNTLNFIIFNFTIALLLSCSDKDNNSQLEYYEIKDEYKKHEIIFENKSISFIIPEYYSDTYIPPDIMLDKWAGSDEKHIFYSTKNKYNSFSFTVVENSYYDGWSMDSIMDYGVLMSIYGEPLMVPFCELRKDKNGLVFELRMSACYDFLKEESHIPKEIQNCVYGDFAYIAKFNNKFYLCVLETREKISEFSYEEKKYIIESVRIEKIKQ